MGAGKQQTWGERLKQPIRWLRSWWWTLYFGYPAGKLKVVAVTGTDGKTTTCWLIYEILKVAGKSVGMMTTAGIKRVVGGKEESEEMGLHVTNPDAKIVQGWFRRLAELGVEYAVVETTSHRLAQNKTVGYNVLVAVVTNLTPEHLDYHGTMENYAAAKARLVRRAPWVALNRDDKWHDFFASQMRQPQRQRRVDFGKSKLKEISPALGGEYNRYNIGAAEAVAKILGVGEETVRRAVKEFAGVPGRREEVKNRLGLRLIVDFAHTPAALEALLASLRREMKPGARLILVFGCTGERDRAKRPVMGEVAARLADRVVVTADDPRDEELGEIYAQIMAGVGEELKAKFEREDDRDRAIERAVKGARRGDTVVAAGMGPEPTILIKGKEIRRLDRAAFERAVGEKAKLS